MKKYFTEAARRAARRQQRKASANRHREKRRLARQARNVVEKAARHARGLLRHRIESGVVPPPHVIAERDVCLSQPQTLSVALLGDPAYGRSALDRRDG